VQQKIDGLLAAAGRAIQNPNQFNRNTPLAVAVRGSRTQTEARIIAHMAASAGDTVQSRGPIPMAPLLH